jgi:hypothetical protein
MATVNELIDSVHPVSESFFVTQIRNRPPRETAESGIVTLQTGRGAR